MSTELVAIQREEVSKHDTGLSSTQIDTVSDVALNQITGVAHKAKYYEELVLYALKDLGVEFRHEFYGSVGNDRFHIDFLIELEGSAVLCIEAVYSNQRLLSKDKINRVINISNTFKKEDDVRGFAIITNAEITPRDKELLKDQDLSIEVLENVISPDGILSAIQKFINNHKK